jgi:hypothetical protein
MKCNQKGTLSIKKRKVKDTFYEYYYIQHRDYSTCKPRTSWCYVGKYDNLPEAYLELLEKDIYPKNEDIPKI